MNMSSLLKYSIMALILVSCQKTEEVEVKPVADFEYYPSTNLKAPVTITFQSKSQNAVYFDWSVCGNNASQQPSVTYTFPKPMVCLIGLRAKGKKGGRYEFYGDDKLITLTIN